MPPSQVVAFVPRRGSLREVVCGVGPPLSLMKKISVFSSSPASWTLASTAPTASSMAESMAENVCRFSSLTFGNRSRYLAVACSGACTALKGRYKKKGWLLCAIDEGDGFAAERVGQVVRLR